MGLGDEMTAEGGVGRDRIALDIDMSSNVFIMFTKGPARRGGSMGSSASTHKKPEFQRLDSWEKT